jgi:hypothetical protein
MGSKQERAGLGEESRRKVGECIYRIYAEYSRIYASQPFCRK